MLPCCGTPLIKSVLKIPTTAMPLVRILSTSCLNEKDKTKEQRVLLRRSKSFSNADGLVISGVVQGSPCFSDHSSYMSSVNDSVCLPEPSYYKRGSPGVSIAAEAEIRSKSRSSCRAHYNFQVGLEISMHTSYV